MYALRLRRGKHAGQELSAVPLSYLRWMLKEEAEEPWFLAHVRAEVGRRGQRFLEAAAVLFVLEEALVEAISEDDTLPEWEAAALCDHVLEVFAAVRKHYGIGEATELLVPARREPVKWGAS